MSISREQALSLIKNNPIEIGHWVGFNDLTELHNQWLKDFLFRTDDQTLQAHRGSYKTTTLSLFLAIHTVICPNESVIYFRKTGGDVAEVARQTYNILETGCIHEIVRALYGFDLKMLKATNGDIQTNLTTSIKGSSQIVGLGIGTSITGKHADIVVTDDIVNINDRISHAERERTKIAYMELQNIKNRWGRFINTGTPWHKDDAFSIMPPAQRFTCYETGLITPEKLDSIRHSMSPSLFAANYELQHIASENALFDTSPVFCNKPELLRDGLAHIDAAYGGEDFTALTCGKRVGDTLYLFGKMWHNHIDVVLERILTEVVRLQCGPIYCEENSDKGFLAKEIKRLDSKVSVRTYHENENKYQKIASYLRKWWKNIVWLEGTDPEYLAQIMDYTEDAEHDDAPDSAACVCRRLDRDRLTEYDSPFQPQRSVFH